MDDLKLFAKNDFQLEILLSTVKMFSDDVGLDFGFDKCAKLTVNRGECLRLVMLYLIVFLLSVN